MEDFSFFPAWKLNHMIMSNEISPVEIMTSCFSKIEELEKLITDHDIGLIKMEVSRTIDTEEGFLKKVRKD